MHALQQDDPRSIGRYRLLARIGGGGMAVVYLGRSGGRLAAVKAVHADLAANQDYRARFRHEVAATRAAGGQYGPGVLGADPDADIPWLATEFLPSVTVRDAVEQTGPLPRDGVWLLAAGLVEALAAIHRAGVAHLDVKPANVLLTADGPRLVDFGIAAPVTAPVATFSPVPAGSRGYMAPEQVTGYGVGPASDVHALGATLAFAATGDPAGAVPDAALAELIVRCRRTDPTARPALADLAAVIAPHGTAVGLPAPVQDLIARQAAEAQNPPLPDVAPAGNPSRRALLAGAGAVLLAGAGLGAAAALVPERTVPGSAAARPDAVPVRSTPPTTTTSAPPPTRQLEFYFYGSGVVHDLTTAVNGGHRKTVRPLPLPYRRTVAIPVSRSTWSIDYHFGSCEVHYTVSVDGYEQVNGIFGGMGDGNPPGHDQGTV